MVYLTSSHGRNTGLRLLVLGNVMGLLFFLFRKEQKKLSNGEKIYRDLYAEMLANQSQELSDQQIAGTTKTKRVASPTTKKERHQHE